MAQYLGLARDFEKAFSPEQLASPNSAAMKHRETARSIAKRVLTLSLGLGVGLAVGSRALFPMLLPIVCQSAEVANLVTKVTRDYLPPPRLMSLVGSGAPNILLNFR